MTNSLIRQATALLNQLRILLGEWLCSLSDYGGYWSPYLSEHYAPELSRPASTRQPR